MKVAFRVDASLSIGIGHGVRCRTLANALRLYGVDVRFICRAHSGHMGAALERDGFQVAWLPTVLDTSDAQDNYAAWLGVSQATDATDTIAALDGERPDWLIVDHYGLDAEWERRLRPHAAHIMAIDDLANRLHDCDVLLDQNYSEDLANRYKTLVPADCRRLLGPRYALLRSEYVAHRKSIAPHADAVQRVLVFFGTEKTVSYTSMALDALCENEFAHLQVDVLTSTDNPHYDAIVQQVSHRPNIQLHGMRPHLADLMANVDMAIGAGGTTMWERMCIGLPSMVVGIADNQQPACEALSRQDLIYYAGPASVVNAGVLKRVLIEMLADPIRLESQRAKGQMLVDGMGIARVLEALWPSAKTDLHLRPASESDMLTYLTWVNDPTVRASAFDSAPISLENHRAWFRRRLNDPNTFLFVLEARGLPIGQIRFECEQDEAIIDYSLDEFVRKRGWANELMRLGVQQFQTAMGASIKAIVKHENLASAAVFLRAGFTEQHTDNDANEPRVFRLPPPAMPNARHYASVLANSNRE